ncbi:MAG: nicotinate-nucleotide adenylyltransferase [Rhizobacter sp.]
MKRIGIFGGSFDPVHLAHVALARTALEQLHLDAVRWIPAGRQWQKTRALTAATHRAAMVELAIAGEPRFTIDRCEIDRSGASYTYDTVRELQAAQPGAQWTLIIGQDQYAGLHTWLGWEKLLERVTLAVANRPGASLEASPEVARVDHEAVALPMMDISSTDIRARVAAGQSVDALVPVAVARYIDQHHLYRGTHGS